MAGNINHYHLEVGRVKIPRRAVSAGWSGVLRDANSGNNIKNFTLKSAFDGGRVSAEKKTNILRA